MADAIQCSQCGKRYRFKPRLIGKRVTCRACGHAFVVSGADEIPEIEPEDLAWPERSASGSPFCRHEARTKRSPGARGDLHKREALAQHIQTHLGKLAHHLDDLVSDLVHIDVHVVAPTDERPYHTLITSGMSDLPMTVPEELEALGFAELIVSLPPDWPLTEEALKEPRFNWPLCWLRMLARLPHAYDTWLGWSHTIPNGDPPKPFADNTRLCCALLLKPMLPPEAFGELPLDDKIIHFYSLVPIYHEEMAFKLKNGIDALLERFAQEEVSELLDVRRPNVCKAGR